MPRMRVRGLRKHGAYTARTLLPGESAAEFDALHERLIAEYEPEGALEHDAVRAIAKCLWRKGRLDGLTRAPPLPLVSCEMIMDPEHVRYVAGKWTYGVRRQNMPDAPPPPPYVPSYVDGPPSRIEPVESSEADDGAAEAGEGRPTLDAIMEEFAVEAVFDAQIRHHVLQLARLKALRLMVGRSKLIEATAGRKQLRLGVMPPAHDPKVEA